MTLSESSIKKIRPLSDRLVVERSGSGEEKTAGGIYIPDQAKEKAQTGVVIAVGPGKMLSTGTLAPMHIKVGETVFFGKYAGTELSEKFVVLREDEVLGIL